MRTSRYWSSCSCPINGTTEMTRDSLSSGLLERKTDETGTPCGDASPHALLRGGEGRGGEAGRVEGEGKKRAEDPTGVRGGCVPAFAGR